MFIHLHGIILGPDEYAGVRQINRDIELVVMHSERMEAC